jgi:hypothetical protein
MLQEVAQRCAEIEGVEQVVAGEARAALGLDHDRAGDLILVADARSWFTYYYWLEDRKAPDFARCVDIHRKPGYDPVELFMDPALRFPKAAVAKRLFKKKLGFRMLMDLIPLDPTLVRGSHGRVPEDPLDWPVLLGAAAGKARDNVEATEVFSLLQQQMLAEATT